MQIFIYLLRLIIGYTPTNKKLICLLDIIDRYCSLPAALARHQYRMRYAATRYLRKALLLSALCAGFMCAEAHAQRPEPSGPVLMGASSDSIKPLQIGDTIPEYLWHMPLQVVNHPEGRDTITLSDYRGKLIILDFWATWCGSCLSAFPKIDSLQTTFPDDVAILKVTYESLTKIKPSIASIVEDSVLRELFPHRLIPHYAWISHDGTLIATTDADALDVLNIKKALRLETADMSPKVDKDGSLPLSPNVPIESVVQYSFLTRGKLDGYASETFLRMSNGVLRGRAKTNQALFDLYLTALIPLFKSEGQLFSRKLCVIEVSDTTGLFYHPNLDPDQLYSFDFIVPTRNSDNLYTEMLHFLNNALPYTGRLEYRESPCLVISQYGQSQLPRSDHGYSIPRLVGLLNARKDSEIPIIIDESGYGGKIAFASLDTDTDYIIKTLGMYGLAVEQTERPILHFILTEKP